MDQFDTERHALMVMSAKPFHKMHFELIRQALESNDEVSVFAGTGEDTMRGDTGDEYPVSGNSMFQLWNDELIPQLKQQFGDRIEIFPSRQPARGVFARMMQLLKEQESGVRPTTFITIMIGDPSERQRYATVDKIKGGAAPKTAQEKLIWRYKDQIEIKVRAAVGQAGAVGRQAGEISATRMRRLLAKAAAGDEAAAEEFKDNLPGFLSPQSREKILSQLISSNKQPEPEQLLVSPKNEGFVIKILERMLIDGSAKIIA
jgi:hypothetical protein